MNTRQRGFFLMARALLVVLILLAMLVIPVWIKRDREQQELERARLERERSGVPARPASGASAPVAGPRPIGHGLSFAPVSGGAEARQQDWVAFGCRGEPVPADRPLQDGCNPREGDTSCRMALPVLCIRPGQLPPPAVPGGGTPVGWVGGELGGTQPVMGAVLESQAVAHARCEAELGAGWRMAALRDVPGGTVIAGARGPGLSAAQTRYWVEAYDVRGNCWGGE